MAAGDVLLFSRKITPAAFKADPFGTVMCALIHLTTRSRWNHAALSLGPDENGDGLMVEATSKGVAVNPIRSTDDVTVIHSALTTTRDWACEAGDSADLFYGGNDLEEVLAWSTGRVGNRYGYVTAFFCGLRNLFPGWSIVQDKAFICSQLVAEATERAGHDYGKSSEKVSPGDLAEHFGVER